MSRKQKKYHFIYKTTCNVTNRFYIGMHSTDDLNDGYIGSGKRLWNSINYHGKDNHSFEILEYCKDRQELKKREEEIVNEELLKENLCMNLAIGGSGGHGARFLTKEQLSKGGAVTCELIKQRFDIDPIFRAKLSKLRSDNMKKLWKQGKVSQVDWTGKKHSEETKAKMRKSKNVGSNNSQFGSCWITNEKENKKIKRGDVIPEGWRLGRKMK